MSQYCTKYQRRQQQQRWTRCATVFAYCVWAVERWHRGRVQTRKITRHSHGLCIQRRQHTQPPLPPKTKRNAIPEAG